MFRIYFAVDGDKNYPDNIVVSAETIGEAETIALLECRKRMQKRFIMLIHIHELEYIVQHGLDTMGKVKIRSI